MANSILLDEFVTSSAGFSSQTARSEPSAAAFKTQVSLTPFENRIKNGCLIKYPWQLRVQ